MLKNQNNILSCFYFGYKTDCLVGYYSFCPIISVTLDGGTNFKKCKENLVEKFSRMRGYFLKLVL